MQNSEFKIDHSESKKLIDKKIYEKFYGEQNNEKYGRLALLFSEFSIILEKPLPVKKFMDHTNAIILLMLQALIHGQVKEQGAYLPWPYSMYSVLRLEAQSA